MGDMLGAIVQLERMVDSLPMPLRVGLRLMTSDGSRLGLVREHMTDTAAQISDLKMSMVHLAEHVDGASRLLCADGSTHMQTSEKLAAMLLPHMTFFHGNAPFWTHGPFADFSSLQFSQTGKPLKDCIESVSNGFVVPR